MKKIKSCICLILVCAFFMASATLASARASGLMGKDGWLIDIYDMNVTTMDDGGIAIKFSVIGTFIMNRLGAESIYIYENNAGNWRLADSFDKDDPNMSDFNAVKYGNTVYFYGEPGKEYKIVVTIFAEDQEGESDSRSKTFYVTAR